MSHDTIASLRAELNDARAALAIAEATIEVAAKRIGAAEAERDAAQAQLTSLDVACAAECCRHAVTLAHLEYAEAAQAREYAARLAEVVHSASATMALDRAIQRAEAAEAQRDALRAQLAAVPVGDLRNIWYRYWIPEGDAVKAWLATLPQP